MEKQILMDDSPDAVTLNNKEEELGPHSDSNALSVKPISKGADKARLSQTTANTHKHSAIKEEANKIGIITHLA